MRSKFFMITAALIVFSMILGACAPAPAPTTGPQEPIVQTVIVEGTPIVITATPPPAEPPAAGPKVLNYPTGGPGDIPTLDPSLASDTTSVQVLEETFVGLTRLDETTLELKPGMATWESEINDEGQEVITFHIRDDIPWVKYDAVSDSVVQVQDCEGNVRMVTAHDFAYTFLRTLDPATGSPYAYVLHGIVGAEEYNTADGAPEDVAVEVLDDYTLRITFKQPAAFNPFIAGLWTGFATPKWVIEGDDCNDPRGDRWTETGFNQSYGPFVMKEWIHDAYLDMVKNPFWPGTEAVPVPKIDMVHYVMLDAPPAFAEYEAGNMDVSNIPLADMDRVMADPTLSQEVNIGPDYCTYYLGFNTKAPVVDDVRVRRALSMAVDRQALIDNVLKGGQEPAQWFSRPGLIASPTMETHPDLGIKYDPEQAKALLQEYLDETGQTADQLQITYMFNTSAGHQRIAETIQQMWADTLGITVNLVNQEWQVYLDTVKSEDTPQVWRLGWCMDYPDAHNFITDNFRAGGSANPARGGVPYGGVNWVNEEAEELMRQAMIESDPAKRVDLYAQAEQILVYEDAVIIPVYWYTSVTATKPYVTRTFGVGGQEHWEKWDINK